MNQVRCNWCVPIVLLSIWYNVCTYHGPSLRACYKYILSCVLDVLLFPYSIPIWTLFYPVFFLCVLRSLLGFGFCCDSFSIRVIGMFIRIYADLTFSFFSEVYDLFQLLCVLSSVFICFPRGVIFRSTVIGVCPVTTNCFAGTS